MHVYILILLHVSWKFVANCFSNSAMYWFEGESFRRKPWHRSRSFIII